MISIAIATSIDYSLFLLSRFREEIERGRRPVAAVELMMGAAGHTVLVSGTTLSLCFAGVATFPIGMLTTMGVGAGATTVLSMIVNLTLTPSCLLTFPRVRGQCVGAFAEFSPDQQLLCAETANAAAEHHFCGLLTPQKGLRG